MTFIWLGLERLCEVNPEWSVRLLSPGIGDSSNCRVLKAYSVCSTFGAWSASEASRKNPTHLFAGFGVIRAYSERLITIARVCLGPRAEDPVRLGHRPSLVMNADFVTSAVVEYVGYFLI